jgi:molecular chaperone GrpE
LIEEGIMKKSKGRQTPPTEQPESEQPVSAPIENQEPDQAKTTAAASGEENPEPAVVEPEYTAPVEPDAAAQAVQEALVGLTIAEYSELQQRIEQAELKSKEYFEGWQRERADFNNYRRRIEQDNVQGKQNLTAQVIRKYLVVVDDLARALKARPTQGEGAAWSEGVELIYRKLTTILDGEGVKPMLADGAMFDPTLHEAITHEDSPDHESGQIIEVVQQGYLLGERVLRPALVRVAR